MQLVLLAAGRGIRLGLDISNKCFTKFNRGNRKMRIVKLK